MSEQNAGSCGANRYNLAFACSGAADVGAIADQAARKLAKEKTAPMGCAAAIAAENPEVLEKAASATKIVVLDGCDKACAKKILEQGGYPDCAHVELGTLGMEKGKTPVNADTIARAAAAASEALAGQIA